MSPESARNQFERIRQPRIVEIPESVINEIETLREDLSRAQERWQELSEYRRNVSSSDPKFVEIYEEIHRRRVKASGLGDDYEIKVEEDMRNLPMTVQTAIDRLSHGKFLDPRNVSHVVHANTLRAKTQKWDVNARINYGQMAGEFWYSTRGNSYVNHWRSNQIVIFSPNNRLLQRVLARSQPDGAYDNVHLLNFADGSPLGDNRTMVSTDGDPFKTNKQQFGSLRFPRSPKVIDQSYRLPRWSDIADCIIDLDARKVYFYS